MPFAIKQGYSLLSFDFSACGKSTGDIVTLGVREENDIEAAVDWAEQTNKYNKCILWGRSMGSVASLLYMARTQNPFI